MVCSSSCSASASPCLSLWGQAAAPFFIHHQNQITDHMSQTTPQSSPHHQNQNQSMDITSPHLQMWPLVPVSSSSPPASFSEIDQQKACFALQHNQERVHQQQQQQQVGRSMFSRLLPLL